MKAVHRVFFPVFALIENTEFVVGGKCIAQRKLLYLEKLFAALLLATPRVKDHLKVKLQSLLESSEGCQSVLLKVLSALDVLVNFYIPAVFRVGYKVRCCTWEGRTAGTGKWAREIMEHVFVLLVHLLQDHDGKNEYVRTLGVALASWQPWMEKIPAVCFVEESCEALLSRMGHRCDVYRTLHGFDNTFDLFLTLPPPRRELKKTRGMLKIGLVNVFASRMRRLIYSDGSNFLFVVPTGAREMHAVFQAAYPDGFEFRGPLPVVVPARLLEHVLRRAVRCLTGKSKVNDEVTKFLDDNIGVRDSEETIKCVRSIEENLAWFQKHRPRKPPRVVAPKPPAKKRLMPKPRGVFMFIVVSFLHSPECIFGNVFIHSFYFHAFQSIYLMPFVNSRRTCV